MAKTKQVQDEPKDGVPDKGTPDTKDGVAQPTPDQTSVDAAELARLKQDIDKMKSVFQKREADLTKDWQAKEAQYQKQLEELATRDMDDEQRKVYESNKATQQMNALQAQIQQLQSESMDYKARMEAVNFFASKGIPVANLNLDEGYDALVQSGWDALDSERQSLMERIEALEKGKTTEEPESKTPPEVETDDFTPGDGPSWKELRERYGVDDDEAIYTMVENGDLDGSVLPVPNVEEES